MFTRDELHSKSLKDLQQLGQDLGINPIGNPGRVESWIVPLLAVGQLAMNDCDQGIGIQRYPNTTIFTDIESALNKLGTPTPPQKAIIKGALRGHWMKRVDERAVQQRIFEMWQARMSLLEALSVLK